MAVTDPHFKGQERAVVERICLYDQNACVSQGAQASNGRVDLMARDRLFS